MERHDDNALIIYTDGSSRPKPRRGGFAFVLLTEDEAGEEKLLEYSFPGALGSTNNEMELMAPIEALQLVTSQHSPVPKSSYAKVVVYADSLMVVNGIGAAESIWPARGWLTTENEPVLNADLWQELVKLSRKAGRVEFRHVKGHKTNPYNRKVDKLAKAAADLTLAIRHQKKMVTRKNQPAANRRSRRSNEGPDRDDPHRRGAGDSRPASPCLQVRGGAGEESELP